MRKLFLAAMLLSALAGRSFAQESKPYPKFEFFVGYSLLSADADHCAVGQLPGGGCLRANGAEEADASGRVNERRRDGGVQASVIRNFNRHAGLKADFSAHFDNSTSVRTQTFDLGDYEVTDEFTIESRRRLYQLMAGPELKARNSTRLTPFGHALVGAAHSSLTREVLSATREIVGRGAVTELAGGSSTWSENKLSWAAGGGLDIRVSGRSSLRTSFDYNPVYLTGVTAPSAGRQNNFRASVGLLFQ